MQRHELHDDAGGDETGRHHPLPVPLAVDLEAPEARNDSEKPSSTVIAVTIPWR
jgi:hypothetical protein